MATLAPQPVSSASLVAAPDSLTASVPPPALPFAPLLARISSVTDHLTASALVPDPAPALLPTSLTASVPPSALQLACSTYNSSGYYACFSSCSFA